MLLFKKKENLQRHLATRRQAGHSIGFVPTMGALHDGHLSLVRRAKADNELVVTSIFVNPTQFNQKDDLDKYPRTIEADIQLLQSCGNDVLFLPEVGEIYPDEEATRVQYDLGGMDRLWEGEFRPGHFNGVAMVVHRLLDIVRPDSLYMGQKDYQQVAVVRALLRALGMDLQLVMCPIVREPDGLAMSSRNRRLSDEQKRRATVLYRTLMAARDAYRAGRPAKEIEREAWQRIADAGLRPEYFALVDGDTLLPVEPATAHRSVVAITAAWAGDVRLIDNMTVFP